MARTGSARAFTSFTTGETQYDYDVTYRSASPYLHAEASPFARKGALLGALRIDAGLRADFSGYSYTSRLAPLDTGAHRRPANTTRSYVHLSPKLGVTLALDSATSVFASYRHGFRAPSQGQLFQQSSAANTVDLAPVKVDAFEVGLRGRLGWRATWQLSAYDMIVRDDIITYVTASNTREATNAGRTRHRGIEAGASAALTSALRLDASWSVSRQTYVDWTPQSATATTAAVSLLGQPHRECAARPRQRVSRLVADCAARRTPGAGVVAHRRLRHRSREHARLRRLRAAQPAGERRRRPRTELFGRVTNLANSAYAELVTYDAFQKDQITPGAPRSVFVGVKTSW